MQVCALRRCGITERLDERCCAVARVGFLVQLVRVVLVTGRLGSPCGLARTTRGSLERGDVVDPPRGGRSE